MKFQVQFFINIFHYLEEKMDKYCNSFWQQFALGYLNIARFTSMSLIMYD